MSTATTLHGLTEAVRVDATTGCDITFRLAQAPLGCRVREQFEGRLDGGQVFRRDEHDVLTAVLGDQYPLMSAVDLVGDLGQPCLDIGQRQRVDEP